MRHFALISYCQVHAEIRQKIINFTAKVSFSDNKTSPASAPGADPLTHPHHIDCNEIFSFQPV